MTLTSLVGFVTDSFQNSSLYIEDIVKSEMHVCKKALKETHIHLRKFVKVVLKSHIISLCSCIDATYTFICVYEIVITAKDKNG